MPVGYGTDNNHVVSAFRCVSIGLLEASVLRINCSSSFCSCLDGVSFVFDILVSYVSCYYEECIAMTATYINEVMGANG